MAYINTTSDVHYRAEGAIHLGEETISLEKLFIIRPTQKAHSIIVFNLYP